MKNALKAIVLVPIALIVVVFAVANREMVTISFDPFNAENPAFALSAPLFLTVILMVMIGVVLGGIATWVTQGSNRSAMRHSKAEADRLRLELQDAKLDLDLIRRNAGSTGNALSIVPKRNAA